MKIRTLDYSFEAHCNENYLKDLAKKFNCKIIKAVGDGGIFEVTVRGQEPDIDKLCKDPCNEYEIGFEVVK